LARRTTGGVSWLAIAVSCTGVFLAYLDVTIVNVALPTIADDLGADVRDASWVVTAYAVAYTALLVTAGRLADARGARGVFAGGLVAFAVASAACALAPDLWTLVAMRVAQGAAGAVLVTVSLALLLPNVPQARRGAVLGTWGAAGAASAALGPPLGGVLAEADWRLVFWINVPLALAAAAATRLVPAPAASHLARFDVAGVALVAALVGAVALAITEGPAQGWGSAPIVGLLAAAAVLAVVLLLVERRARSPVLDPAVLAVRSFAVATGAGAVFFFAFLGNALLGVLVLQGAWDYSPLKAGLAVAPSAAVATVFAPVAGRLVDAFGARRVGSVGLVLFAVALVLLAVGLPDEPAYLERYLPFAVLASIGISMAFPAITQSATHELPPSAMGTGTGVLSTIRQTGGVLGIATVVSLLGDLPGDIASYRVAYGLLALAAILAAVVMLGLRPHARPAA